MVPRYIFIQYSLILDMSSFLDVTRNKYDYSFLKKLFELIHLLTAFSLPFIIAFELIRDSESSLKMSISTIYLLYIIISFIHISLNFSSDVQGVFDQLISDGGDKYFKIFKQFIQYRKIIVLVLNSLSIILFAIMLSSEITNIIIVIFICSLILNMIAYIIIDPIYYQNDTYIIGQFMINIVLFIIWVFFSTMN